MFFARIDARRKRRCIVFRVDTTSIRGNRILPRFLMIRGKIFTVPERAFETNRIRRKFDSGYAFSNRTARSRNRSIIGLFCQGRKKYALLTSHDRLSSHERDERFAFALAMNPRRGASTGATELGKINVRRALDPEMNRFDIEISPTVDRLPRERPNERNKPS